MAIPMAMMRPSGREPRAPPPGRAYLAATCFADCPGWPSCAGMWRAQNPLAIAGRLQR